MKEPKLKTVYVCSNCGETSPRWMGRCPSCGSWNTMNEDVVAEAPKAGTAAAKQAAAARPEGVTTLTAKRLSEISMTEEKSRILTGISELDRVLGGGIVLGGVVLLSGEPGVGKSTMLLQLCGAISNQHSVLYITGEESVRQVKLRAARLKVPQDNIFLAAENDVDEICGLIEKEKPDLVVIDSIQTMYLSANESPMGSPAQIRDCTAVLVRLLSIGITAGYHPVRSRVGWQVWLTERVLDAARTYLFPLYASLLTPLWMTVPCGPWTSTSPFLNSSPSGLFLSSISSRAILS